MTDSNGIDDRRAEQRRTVRLTGTLFHPVTGKQIACIVTDLCSGGAGLWCEQPLPSGTALTVYIDGFGRFDGVSSRDMLGHTGITFTDTGQCAGLKESLLAYARDGMTAVTRLRRDPRAAPDAAIGHFRRANGEAVPAGGRGRASGRHPRLGGASQRGGRGRPVSGTARLMFQAFQGSRAVVRISGSAICSFFQRIAVSIRVRPDGWSKRTRSSQSPGSSLR